MMSRLVLLVYLAGVMGITLVHDPVWLGGLLVVALVLAGPLRWQLLQRTVWAVLAFNLTVSLGYVLVASWQGKLRIDYLLLVNLRVLLLVYLGFWFIARVNVLAALAGWPLASLIATLAIGQSKAFERIVRDFGLAFTSRNLSPPRRLDRTRHAAAQVQTLLDKAVAAAGETAQAMRSRGTWGD